MLEGKNINLRVVEKEDLPLLVDWTNDIAISGEYLPIRQDSRAEVEKMWIEATPDKKWFIIEKTDGSKIGLIGHFPVPGCLEIAYGLIPSEWGKGYCSEAAQIMVDYLFLSKEIIRIQAHADVRNVASQRVLEKTNFKKEGIVRKSNFRKGEWRDRYLFSILREEWKEPKILAKTK